MKFPTRGRHMRRLCEMQLTYHKHPSVRQLAEQLTQISTILQNKVEILDLYEFNSSGEVCQTRKQIRNSNFGEMNDLL